MRRQRIIVWMSAGLMIAFTILASVPVTMTLGR